MITMQAKYNKQKNYLIVLGLSILFYLPYTLHTFYNMDTIDVLALDFSLNPLPDMLNMLSTQYKPLYGFFMFNYLPYKLGISSQILILLGVIFFSIAIYGFVNFFVPSLSKLSKLIIYLLAFANPYIFMESGWWGQFMGQGLVSCLYLASFILIDRYKNSKVGFKKIALAYSVPIFSVVFGLNFFMPSFFHFVVLAFLYVVKNHLDNPFKSVKEFFIFSLPLFIIIGLASIIYIVEIKSLFALFNININDGRAKGYDILSSFSELTGRLSRVYNSYPKVYNLLTLLNALVLFLLVKRSFINVIFMVLTPFVILFSYVIMIVFNMYSTRILNFPNYYLFVFLLAFTLVYLKNYQLKTMIKIASLGLIVFFYFSSYFWAIWGLRHENIVKTELVKLEKVAYSKFEKGLPIFIIDTPRDWNKKLTKVPLLVKKLFSPQGYGLNNSFTWGFSGTLYGFKNITGRFAVKPKIPKIKAGILRKQGKIYPADGSMFLHDGTIYVVGDL